MWRLATRSAEDVAEAGRVPDFAEPECAGEHAVLDASYARRVGGLDGRGELDEARQGKALGKVAKNIVR